MEKRQIVINSQLINYFKKPAKDGNIFLNAIFLHGWRSQGMVWQNIVNNQVFSKYNCYLLDLPGFGDSPTPKFAFGLANYGELVKEFINKHNLQDVSVVGHSFGGRIAMWLAANDQRISKLIIVNGAGIKANKIKSKIFLAGAKLVKPLFNLFGFRNIRTWIYKLIGSEDYLATPELTETYKLVTGVDVREFLPKIMAPVLLVWGDKDNDTPLSFAKIFNENIKNSKLVVLAGAGHFSFLDKPQEFCREVENFLNEIACAY